MESGKILVPRSESRRGAGRFNRVTAINVVSIVVVYNEVDDVVGCLKKIIDNAKHPIVVVDNSDVPMTELLLRIDELPVSIHYLKAKKNYGSAGGFALGMRYAIDELGADWVWLHDQDGFPSHDCLTQLKEGILKEANIGIVAPVVRTCETGDVHGGFRAQLNWFGNTVSLNEKRLLQNSWRELDVVGSAGLLISAKCISQIGTYDCNFFVGYEDYEFSQRVRQHGWRIWLSPRATYYHPDLFAKYGTRKVLQSSAIDWFRPLYLSADGRSEEAPAKPLAILLTRYGNGAGNAVSIVYSLLRNLSASSKVTRYERMQKFFRGIKEGRATKLRCVEDWSEMVDEIRNIGKPLT